MKHTDVPKVFPFTAYAEGADYTVDEVQVIAYALSPGASVPVFIIRELNGQTYQSAVDYFYLTRAEVEEIITREIQQEVENCLDMIKQCQASIELLKKRPLYREPPKTQD